MKFIGAHVSAAGGVQHAPIRAEEIGAAAFALFTKNQKRWSAKPLIQEDIEAFRDNLSSVGIRPEHILPHDSYLINLANPEDEKRDKSLNSFIDEAQRTAELGLLFLNFHPGAHLGGMKEADAIARIAEGIDRVCETVEHVIFVAETTAGQGTALGYKFEHLRDLIAAAAYPDRIGVCIDTCHIFAAGYDIRTEETYTVTMEQFESVIGFEKLQAMHLNDAKSEFGSRVDRHASLRHGNIGWEAFRFIMQDPRLDNMPLILETPDPDRWADEIQQLKGEENGV